MRFLLLAITVIVVSVAAGIGAMLPLTTASEQLNGALLVAAGLFACLVVSLTHFWQQRRELAQHNKRINYLELLLEQGSTSIMLLDRDLSITYWNPRYAEMMKIDPAALNNRFNVRHLGKYVPEKTIKRIERAVTQGNAWKGEMRFPVEGKDLHTMVTITPLLDKNGHWELLLVNTEDISEHKAIADRLFIREHYSMLTGLPNRDLAIKKLKNSVAACRSSGESFVLAHIDFDRIRYLNDSLGHIVVDKLLNAIADRLRGQLGDDQVLAHIGADEFLLLFSDGTGLEESGAVCDTLLEAVRQPFYIDNNEINLTASIGLTQFPNDGINASALMRSAEAAMFVAKDEGGNRSCVFDESMSSRIERRMQTENHLRHAIERDEFILHYQPVIDLASGQLTGAEVLLRWRNETLQNPPPDAFIHIAEDSGLIVHIGDWVLQQACKQAVNWQQQGLPPLRLAVNISARQFREGEVVKSVQRALADSGLPADQLELEITEGLLINDAANIRQCFSALKELGVRLSIDDFGTGYASLSYLKRYPFDTLKIDRSFIHDIDGSEDSITLANAIIAMAHSFDMEVVAEGVETLAQRRILRERNCDLVQGYLYSPALPAQSFISWAKRYHDIQLAQYV